MKTSLDSIINDFILNNTRLKADIFCVKEKNKDY